MRRAPLVVAAVASLLLGLPSAGLGQRAARADELDDGDDSRLTGRDIYERVLDNRFRSFIKESSLSSGDRGGRIQESRLRMHWQDFRDGDDDVVVSKTLVKYSYPFDVRHSGYLIIANQGRINDQFVYLPSRRQVVRVNLRGEAVFGTDFSFEDIIPRELEDSEYERLPDEDLLGETVFVVEAKPTEEANSEYSRFRFYIEKQRYVPYRTRYWDRAGVEVKELIVDPGTIREFDGIWVPMKLTMRNHVLDSYTELRIEELIANPVLPETTFDLRRLESH